MAHPHVRLGWYQYQPEALAPLADGRFVRQHRLCAVVFVNVQVGRLSLDAETSPSRFRRMRRST